MMLMQTVFMKGKERVQGLSRRQRQVEVEDVSQRARQEALGIRSTELASSLISRVTSHQLLERERESRHATRSAVSLISHFIVVTYVLYR